MIKCLGMESDNMLDNIISVEDLYQYMDKNVKYGWYGIDGKVRINSLKEFKEFYRTMNVEDVIKYGVGTCPDYVNLVKYYLDKNNIDNKIFAIVGYEEVDGIDKERVHFMIFYNMNNKWYQFEQASRFFRGIFEYESLEDLRNKVLFKYEGILKNKMLLELDCIPVGIGYNELSELIISKMNNS